MKVTCPECKRRVRIRRGEQLSCRCGKHLHYRSFFRNRISYEVYLIDANILIYADNKKDARSKSCLKVLSFDSRLIKIGTTDMILDEIKSDVPFRVPEHMILYKIKRISEMVQGLRTNVLKQPSSADLSLVQAAIEHPEIKGIVTYDRDFGRIATRGMIERRSSRAFWLGNASAFLNKYEVASQQSE